MLWLSSAGRGRSSKWVWPSSPVYIRTIMRVLLPTEGSSCTKAYSASSPTTKPLASSLRTLPPDKPTAGVFMPHGGRTFSVGSGTGPSSSVIPNEHQPWSSTRDESCSEMLFEKEIRVWIVVKAVDLSPSGAAVKLESLSQSAVRIEPKSLDG